MSKSILLSEDKDFPILRFLWKWKIATTAMLGLRFYNSDKSSGIYQRLVRLEAANFIQSRADKFGKRFVWMLTTKGFCTTKAAFQNLPRTVLSRKKSDTTFWSMLFILETGLREFLKSPRFLPSSS